MNRSATFLLILAAAMGACTQIPLTEAPYEGARDAAQARSPYQRAAQGVPDSQNAAPALSLADSDTKAYIVVQPEKTGLRNGIDDGRNTYIGLAAPATDNLIVFDTEGKRLEFSKHGRVIAVPGVHKGLLLRDGAGNSFLAPNPNATPADAFALDRDSDVVAARNELVGVMSQMAAFKAAIKNADAATGNRPATETVPATGAQPSLEARLASASARASQGASQSTRTDAIKVTPIAIRPQLQSPPKMELTNETYQVLPDGQILMRVFFASGGRAVVRPDDGLQMLEDQAKSAQFVKIQGFTDAIGSPTLNTILGQQRAEAIANYLIGRGVPESRIFVSSKGATEFLAENESAKGRALNRRVEVVFVTPRAQ